MIHPNIELMRRYSATLTAARAAEVLPFFTEDCVLHIPGRSPHAGDYHGQDAVLAYYTRIFQDTEGKFENLGIDDILASDTHAAVFAVVHAVLLRPMPVPEPDRLIGIGDVYPTITPNDILASDTHAATLVHWRVTRGDRTIDINRVVVYRIDEGRIAEIWVRDWDQYAYDELFADVPAAT